MESIYVRKEMAQVAYDDFKDRLDNIGLGDKEVKLEDATEEELEGSNYVGQEIMVISMDDDQLDGDEEDDVMELRDDVEMDYGVHMPD